MGTFHLHVDSNGGIRHVEVDLVAVSESRAPSGLRGQSVTAMTPRRGTVRGPPLGPR